MLFWLFVIVLMAAMGAAGYIGFRYYTTGDTGLNLSGWFGPRPEPRLGVIEQASVDSRRKLVLIRRDDVEHLIMTGGPVDVVIETGIAAQQHHHAYAEAPAPREHSARPPSLEPPSPPVFTRQPRSFGQAVNE